MKMLFFVISLLTTSTLFAQYSEEVVEILYQQNELTSIGVLPTVAYLDQNLGGVIINTDDELYTFTGISGLDGSSNLYSVDLNTGTITFEVSTPPVQLLQYRSDNGMLIGMHKTAGGDVSLATVDFKTGNWTPFTAIPQLKNTVFSTHNSAIDLDNQRFYFTGSLAGVNLWQVFVIDITDGSLVKIIANPPQGKPVLGLAFDQDRNRLIGLSELTPDVMTLLEVNPANDSIRIIKTINEIENIFGGHRYWAYDDEGDQFFVIGLDQAGESQLYVLNSQDGSILYQHPYEDDAWIMEEHSPLELRYNPDTKQLLGVRKGETLPTSTSSPEPLVAQMNVFPNPVSNGLLSVTLLNNQEAFQEVALINASGLQVYQQTELSGNTLEISTQGFAPGLYFLQGITDRGIYNASVLIRSAEK